MALQKAGGTNVDALSSAPANAGALVDFLETQLVNAGWTIISGGGTDNIKFQSLATTEGMQVRVEVDVTGSDVTFTLHNPGESVSSTTGIVRATVDAVNDWRLMANKFAFVLYENTAPVALSAVGAKKWVLAGTLFLESFLTPTITEVGFIFGDHRSTTSDAHDHSFRRRPQLENQPGNYTVLYNAAIQSYNNISTPNNERGYAGFVLPCWPMMNTEDFQGAPTKLTQWVTGEHFISDPILGWGAPSQTTNFRVARGQLFDVQIFQDDNLNRNDIVTVGLDSFRIVNDSDASGDAWPFAMGWLQP